MQDLRRKWKANLRSFAFITAHLSLRRLPRPLLVLVYVVCMICMAGSLLLLAHSAARAGVGVPDFARALTTDIGLQGRVMWIDATANIDRIMTREGVEDVVAHCKKANFTMLVVDAKPVSGQVVYNSKIAEHLREWKGKTYPDFDVLGAFVDAGHKAGMQVAASFNVFGEGHKYFHVGLAYRKPEWQSIAYIVDRNL